MTYQPFILLLHKLGFHLPDDTNRLWVRIPNFWTAETLFSLADKLGPIDRSLFKFDVSHFNYKLPKVQKISEVGDATSAQALTANKGPTQKSHIRYKHLKRPIHLK